MVVVTTDGGTTWTTETLPGAKFAPAGLSCATTTDCFALGDTNGLAVLATTDGGTTWTTETLPSHLGNLRDISCATASTCWVSSDAGVFATTDGGTTWTTETLPAGVQVGALSCATASDCEGGSSRSRDRRHHRRGEHVEPAEPPGRRRLPERRLVPDGVGLRRRGCG